MKPVLLMCLISMVVPGLDSVFCKCLVIILGYFFNCVAVTGSQGYQEECALGRSASLERIEGEICDGYRCSCPPQFPVCLQWRKHWHREEAPQVPEPRAGGHPKPTSGLPHVRGQVVGWWDGLVCI